tara:strand:- start:3513 stop:4241 length:729 start_codon:yes stop_codon:yes gene_type:complete
MADQDYIQKIVEELSAKLGIVQSEVIIALKELVKGKSNSEAVIILNQINIDTVMKSKTSGIISSYIKGNAGVLLGKEMFAQVQEKPLQALLDQSERYLAGEIASMGNVIKQEVINGVLNDRTADDILEMIGKKGYGANVGMKRIITDGLNNYSRSVSRLMMDEAPDNTKYIYIGPADEKTRDFCLSAIQIGAITLKQIQNMGWSASLTEGGGVNCRHSWEMVSNDVRSQFYRKEEAEKILND